MKAENLLYEVFESQLASPELSSESFEQFVGRVVETYMTELSGRGYYIPATARESIREELQDEVTEMTRKKTYGFLTLEEFRKAR
jgi:hypothetical protein